MTKKLIIGLVFSTAAMGVLAADMHTVSKGDTLFSIASRYHTSVEKLRSNNNLRSSDIRIGQKLVVSGSSVRPAAARAVAAKPANVAGNVYIVRRGDTLSGIADAYGVGLTALARHNGLSLRKSIQTGQKIRIPAGRYQMAAAKKHVSPATAPLVQHSARPVQLESSAVLVVDAGTGKTLFAKNADVVRPIASITKLMTAMVALDANLALDETLVIGEGDVDHLKHTTSRLPLGTRLSRYEMLRLALMSSENRAASALSRHYPGGKPAFLQAMNAKAKALGMNNTRFEDATGLTPHNVSTAEDLAKMVEAASHYDLIHKFTTTEQRNVAIRPRSTPLQYRNSNLLVRNGQWDIEVSKTGYINEAGRCLVMKAEVANRPALLVLLDANGKYSPVGDANRIKKWIESGGAGVTVASL